jgi:serine/threonine protein kinase
MMNFNFPNNIFYDGRCLKSEKSGTTWGKYLDLSSPEQNIVSINNTDYILNYLDPSKPKSKGGNSIVLKLYQADNFDWDDINYEEPDKILKILKVSKKDNTPNQPIHNRFEKEIEALYNCKNASLQSIIKIHENGICKLNVSKGPRRHNQKFMYYTMEPADSDLSNYMTKNPNLDLASRVSLCSSIAKCLQDLYSLGYYHRDLKPDNILIIEDQWKIADLGLVSHRDINFKIDKESELIGPRGWLSPEAINKKLCGDSPVLSRKHDCIIDHQSDLFQLGKLFCYILQGNNPMGIINLRDLDIEDHALKHLVLKMLYYKKKKRYKKIQAIINNIKPIERKLAF